MKPPSSFQVLCFIMIALISSFALPFAILANGSREEIDARYADARHVEKIDAKIDARHIEAVAAKETVAAAEDVAASKPDAPTDTADVTTTTAAVPATAAAVPAKTAAVPPTTAAVPTATAAVPADAVAAPADAVAAASVPGKFVVASADPFQTFPETAPSATEATPEPQLLPAPPVSALEGPEECLVADICIDHYLWAFYQRTPKQDTNRVHERRKVLVKRKGKTRSVTKVFTKLVDADFTWKDPAAAAKAGMPLMTYVIGGMDRQFRRNLLYMLLAAEREGLSPGITSGFRDDYRQSIASGQKAASNRSFHGGSLRGGYGHGLAADVVSVIGKTRYNRWYHSERFWNWIDANGYKFGIGRPYLNKDAPHVGPIDGREYVARRGVFQAASADKKQKVAATQSDSDKKSTKLESKKSDSKKAKLSVAAKKPLQKSADATPAKKSAGK